VILDQIYLLSHEKTFEIERQKSKENSATESTDNGYVCFIMAFGWPLERMLVYIRSTDLCISIDATVYPLLIVFQGTLYSWRSPPGCVLTGP
jgi:hypothetical protein